MVMKTRRRKNEPGISIIIIGVFILNVFSMRITRYFKLEKWQVSLGLIAFAMVLYFLSIYLTHYFIKKRVPEMASFEEALPDIQLWELTAGLGIVPKWVSAIGLLPISILITAILPWITTFIRWIIVKSQ